MRITNRVLVYTYGDGKLPHRDRGARILRQLNNTIPAGWVSLIARDGLDRTLQKVVEQEKECAMSTAVGAVKPAVEVVISVNEPGRDPFAMRSGSGFGLVIAADDASGRVIYASFETSVSNFSEGVEVLRGTSRKIVKSLTTSVLGIFSTGVEDIKTRLSIRLARLIDRLVFPQSVYHLAFPTRGFILNLE